MIKIKRVYDPPSSDDGVRILVDRLWPRGISKEKGKIDRWMKELSPSPELRKWFSHEPPKWEEFNRRYATELADKHEPLIALKEEGDAKTVTLVYGAKDEERNQAVALMRILKDM